MPILRHNLIFLLVAFATIIHSIFVKNIFFEMLIFINVNQG